MNHLVTLSFVRTAGEEKTDMVVIFDDRDLTQEEVVNRLENHFGEEFSNMIIVTKDQNEIVFRELREGVEVASTASDGIDPTGMMSMMSALGSMPGTMENVEMDSDEEPVELEETSCVEDK